MHVLMLHCAKLFLPLCLKNALKDVSNFFNIVAETGKSFFFFF